MSTKQQIEYIVEHFEKSGPAAFFKVLSEENAGIGAVLRILYKRPSELTAGNISDFMYVSTARVAVLLRNMASKGLITKDIDANDARLTIVYLSPYGMEVAQKMQTELYSQISRVIDRVGMEKLEQFIAISAEIKSALSPPQVEF